MPLTCLQNRFISKCRKDPKPILEMLKDCQVGIGTFLKWRLDREFSRQFKLATTGVTDDMLAELRMAFAVSGRLVSADVFSTALKRNAPKPRGKQAKKRAATSRRRRQLTPTQHRRCIDVSSSRNNRRAGAGSP